MATLPTGPGFTKADLRPEEKYMSSNLNDLTTQTVQVVDPVWLVDVSYPELTISEARELIPFLFGLKGKQTQFEVILPQYKAPRAGSIDASACSVAAGQTGNQLVITDWDLALRTGNPQPGDIFKLSGSKKVYMVQAVDTTVGNQLTITTYPSLITPTLVSDVVEFNNVKISVRLSTEQPPTPSINTRGVYNAMSLSMREDLTE